jgi:methylisocitrate lyase
MIPAIVDADTGFGPPRGDAAVKEFEQAGLAGMQIEDQELPKRCGHLPESGWSRRARWW